MFHAYFGLREEPFGVSPDSRFLIPFSQHREAAAALYYAILQRRGLVLLVGRAGLGKSTLLVQLLERLKGETATAYLPHPWFNSESVWPAVLNGFGLESSGNPGDDYRRFEKFLVEINRRGRTCTLVIDEAQNLDRATLEAIRLLSNFETPQGKLLQIVLAGQPPLVHTLARPDCEQIRQRINVVAKLEPLSPPDVQQYVHSRLQVAGAQRDLFTPAALEAIAAGSQGVPRNINTICFNALTLAMAKSAPRVDRPEIEEVLRDLDIRLSDTRVRTPESLGIVQISAPLLSYHAPTAHLRIPFIIATLVLAATAWAAVQTGIQL